MTDSTMAGVPGNTNAAKPLKKRASAVLHLRARPVDKDRWKRAAKRSKKELAVWVRDILNAKARA